MFHSVQSTIGGRIIIIETGKLAGQANSAVTVRCGDSVVLVTVCIGDAPRESNSDFVRLTVDYEERHYAVGKIPGSFIRREGRPGEQATLAARLTDRSLRPLLHKSFPNDIQIVVTVLSTDQENDPDLLAVVGASAALTISSVPFNGPVGAVRIGYINDTMILNPTLPQISDSSIDVIVASTSNAVVMVEADAQETPDDLILDAVKMGHEANQGLIKLQQELQRLCGKPKIEVSTQQTNSELVMAIAADFRDRFAEAVSQPNRDDREKSTTAIRQEATEKLKDKFSEPEIMEAVEEQLKEAARKRILENRLHLDGRELKQIRPITAEVGLLPRTHGSGLFSRGQTQVLTITTLGSPRQEQLLDGLRLEETKRFMHHYNFPPFSTGEVKRMGSPGRREIGHGALAERALVPVIPSEKDFAYTIRLVSEVLSSNGSTSMASVCSSSLSLMDAGVPIKAPVVGIAMGLVTGQDNKYVVLTDIEGMEDHYGDMDFKVAGTDQGVTAIQLDIKLQGISTQVLSEAVKQAREAHKEILEKLRQTISSNRTELSQYAPRMYKISINPNKIGNVIGPGGKTIRSITEQTKATIDIENDGTVMIGSPSEQAAQMAIAMIEDLTREVEVGSVYTGKVTRTTNFGAFVEILPSKEGLVHISELADHHVSQVEDVVKVGDEIMVKVTEIDHLGRVNLSRRAVFSSGVPGDKAMDSALGTHPNQYQRRRPHPTTDQRGGKDSQHRYHRKDRR